MMSDSPNRSPSYLSGNADQRLARVALLTSGVLLLAWLIGLGRLQLEVPGAQAQEAVIVRLEPAVASGDVGEVFTVQVLVDNVPSTGVQGWQVSIAFDPAVVQLNPGQSTSTYFASNLYAAGGYNAFPIVNVASDKIILGQALIGAPPSYPSGSNLLLATIQWRGVAGGRSALDTHGSRVIKDALTGTAYSPLTEWDGEIIVAGAASTPTPTGTPPSAWRIYLPLLLREGS